MRYAEFEATFNDKGFDIVERLGEIGLDAESEFRIFNAKGLAKILEKYRDGDIKEAFLFYKVNYSNVNPKTIYRSLMRSASRDRWYKESIEFGKESDEHIARILASDDTYVGSVSVVILTPSSYKIEVFNELEEAVEFLIDEFRL